MSEDRAASAGENKTRVSRGMVKRRSKGHPPLSFRFCIIAYARSMLSPSLRVFRVHSSSGGRIVLQSLEPSVLPPWDPKPTLGLSCQLLEFPCLRLSPWSLPIPLHTFPNCYSKACTGLSLAIICLHSGPDLCLDLRPRARTLTHLCDPRPTSDLGKTPFSSALSIPWLSLPRPFPLVLFGTLPHHLRSQAELPHWSFRSPTLSPTLGRVCRPLQTLHRRTIGPT